MKRNSVLVLGLGMLLGAGLLVPSCGSSSGGGNNRDGAPGDAKKDVSPADSKGGTTGIGGATGAGGVVVLDGGQGGTTGAGGVVGPDGGQGGATGTGGVVGPDGGQGGTTGAGGATAAPDGAVDHAENPSPEPGIDGGPGIDGPRDTARDTNRDSVDAPSPPDLGHNDVAHFDASGNLDAEAIDAPADAPQDVATSNPDLGIDMEIDTSGIDGGIDSEIDSI